MICYAYKFFQSVGEKSNRVLDSKTVTSATIAAAIEHIVRALFCRASVGNFICFEIRMKMRFFIGTSPEKLDFPGWQRFFF